MTYFNDFDTCRHSYGDSTVDSCRRAALGGTTPPEMISSWHGRGTWLFYIISTRFTYSFTKFLPHLVSFLSSKLSLCRTLKPISISIYSNVWMPVDDTFFLLISHCMARNRRTFDSNSNPASRGWCSCFQNCGFAIARFVAFEHQFERITSYNTAMKNMNVCWLRTF